LYGAGYGLDHAPRVVGFLPAGHLVLQDYRTLTVFERCAPTDPPSDAPEPWKPQVSYYEEGDLQGLPLEGFAPPVATWCTGQPGWRRVTGHELEAVLRPPHAPGASFRQW
jgi:hypothetical protein